MLDQYVRDVPDIGHASIHAEEGSDLYFSLSGNSVKNEDLTPLFFQAFGV